jgi:hypothetical protein
MRRSGDFSRNYGVIIGAILYLFSIFATRRSSVLAWPRFIALTQLCALELLQRFGWPTFLVK